ncbi:MAG: type II toxin-antitoxin system Phd/YefM family antitoxin [Nitrospirota bacterium]
MTINLKEDIKPISFIKTNAAKMLSSVNKNHHPIIITQHGEAKAVLMDIHSYQEMKNAFALMNMIHLAEEEIRKGDLEESDTVFGELKKKYFSK